MQLTRTTILPTDRKADALAILGQLIDDEPLVLFVVLDRDDESRTLVDRAAKGAGAEGPGWVVWARRPGQVRERINRLEGADKLGENLEQVRAFTLSFSDSVVDVFRRSNPIPDAFDILVAYMAAIAARP